MPIISKRKSDLNYPTLNDSKYRQIFGKTIVVKYGGAALEHQEFFKPTINDIAFLQKVGANIVVVHGGSRQLNERMKEKGLEVTSIDGLRYTSDKTIEEAKIVFSEINAQVVSLLQQGGVTAVGLLGDEDSIIQASLKNFKMYGYVGNVKNVDVTRIKAIILQGKVPVISALGRTVDGQVLNINADEVASAVASALCSDIFMFITDVEGVFQNPKDSSSVLSYIDDEVIEKLLSERVISKGMTPKIKACLGAVRNGVPIVHILSARQPKALITEIIGESNYGTKLVRKGNLPTIKY
jgi:acetylglutamate kinase